MDTYGLLTEYMTKADEVEINREAQQVVGIIPGNGMLANSHPGLDNMEMGDNCIRKIPSFNRTHPAVGSSTHVHGVCFKTRRAVPAGSGTCACTNVSIHLLRVTHACMTSITCDEQNSLRCTGMIGTEIGQISFPMLPCRKITFVPMLSCTSLSIWWIVTLTVRWPGRCGIYFGTFYKTCDRIFCK